MGVRDWILDHFWLKLRHRKRKKLDPREEYRRAKQECIDAGAKLANKAVDQVFKPYEPIKSQHLFPSSDFDRVPYTRPTPKRLGDIKAVRKMRHGHQAPWYRKSVKANIKPDEDD